MVTSSHKWKILEWDENIQNKQTLWLYSVALQICEQTNHSSILVKKKNQAWFQQKLIIQ